MGAGNNEFTVVDISTPASPTIVGTVNNNFLAGAYRVRVHGNFAYVAAASANAVGAIDISTPASPRFAAGYSDHTNLNHVTGLDLDSTGAHLIAAAPFLSTESNIAFPPFPVYPAQAGFPTWTGTVSSILLDPNPIAVSIKTSAAPPNPTGQTTADFVFAANDAVSTMTCQLDANAPAPCATATTQHYSAGQLGAGAHTFTVTATSQPWR